MMRVTNFIYVIAFLICCNCLYSKGITQNEEGQTNLYAALSDNSLVRQDDTEQEEGILSNKNIRIINLGPIINYKGVDYAPTITADGKTLFYVSDRSGSQYNKDWGIYTHDFWAAKKVTGLIQYFLNHIILTPPHILEHLE